MHDRTERNKTVEVQELSKLTSSTSPRGRCVGASDRLIPLSFFGSSDGGMMKERVTCVAMMRMRQGFSIVASVLMSALAIALCFRPHDAS